MVKQDDKDNNEKVIKSPLLSIPKNSRRNNESDDEEEEVEDYNTSEDENNNNNNNNNNNRKKLQISKENINEENINDSYFPIPLDILIPDIDSDELVKKFKEKKDPEKSGSYCYAYHVNYEVKHRDDKKVNIKLLDDISFYLKPREMTLILGSPGCGKSTIFQLLAGLAKTENHFSGTLLFNGHPINPINHHRDISYVPQDDLHMPTLTVKETLRFALECQAAGNLTFDDKSKIVRDVLKVLGLEKSADTLVGNNFIRGISGGQKKRVTIGVSIIKGSNLILMDEPTSGLDSSTSLDIMISLKKYVLYTYAPALIALLQPSVQLTSLFDKLMILSRGRIVFFGKLSEALPYFESLGYVCPIQGNPAEFFQEVIDNSERYSIIKPPPLKTSDDFFRDYRNSIYYKKLMEKMETHKDGIIDQDIDKAHLMDSSQRQLPVYPTRTWYQLGLCMHRGTRMLMRNYYNAVTRIAQAIIFGLLLGGLFFQLDHDQQGGSSRFGVIYFIMVTIIFGAFSAVNAFFQERAIFYSQRNMKYYKTIAYFIASVSTDVPIGAIYVIVLGSIVYWMAGFRSSFIRFGYFLTMLFFTDNMSLAFAKMTASISPTVEIANVFCSIVLAMFILFSGFTAPKPSIGGWWIWMYYISPYTWIFYGLLLNELSDHAYFCRDVELVPPTSNPLLNLPLNVGGYGGFQACQFTNGNGFLASFGLTNSDGFKWVCLALVIIYAAFFYFIAFLGLNYLNFGKKQKSLLVKPPIYKRFYYKYIKKQDIDNEVLNYEEDDLVSHDINRDDYGQTSNNTNTTTYAENGRPIEEKERPVPSTTLRNRHVLDESRSQVVTIANPVSSSVTPNPLLEQRGCYLSFKDLSYAVDFKGKDPETKEKTKKRLELLKNVNGFAVPGKMLALMGPSGAGKSTLLDVLANRKTGGYIDGEILVNGRHPDKFFNRIMSYVEQFDILPPTQTCREAIEFSATCRLTKDVTPEQKAEYIDKILDVLSLNKIQNLKIGVLGNGLSLSQRKRVNIGVELAANPSLIFLDEPTTGLDSGDAYKVINIVSRVAKRLNRTIICTVHQPSSGIFSKFDSLLLLKNGENVFFGDLGKDNENILNYLKGYGMEIKPHINPADFILSMAEEDKMIERPDGEKVPFDAVSAYKGSKFDTECKETLEHGIVPDDFQHREYNSIFASSWMVQFKALSRRAFLSRVRRPVIVGSFALRSLWLAIILGTLFVRMGFEQQDARNRVSLLFFSFIFAGMVAIGSIPTTVQERGVFYREVTSGFYHSTAYSFSYLLTSYPFTLGTAILYIVPAFFLAGLDTGQHSAKFWYCFFLFLIAYLMYDAMGLMLAVCLPNEIVASTICGMILSITALFGGFIIPATSMAKGFLWLHYLDFLRYPLEASTTNEFVGQQYHCTNNVGSVFIPGADKHYCPVTDGQTFIEGYGFHVWMRYIDIAPIMGFFLIFLGLTLWGFKKVRWIVR